jgi:hypothetical protein
LAQPSGNATIRAFATYHGDLIAGGDFRRPDGVSNDIARWDGQQWHSMGVGAGAGIGFPGSVWSLATLGGKLVAGGRFPQMDNVPANNIAQWNGESWSAMGQGVRGGTGIVRQLNRIGLTLFATGGFTIAGEDVSAYLARWRVGSCHIADIAPEGGDGAVNIDDLIAVILGWGECPDDDDEPCDADVNEDGQVDADDLAAVILNWSP